MNLTLEQIDRLKASRASLNRFINKTRLDVIDHWDLEGTPDKSSKGKKVIAAAKSKSDVAEEVVKGFVDAAVVSAVDNDVGAVAASSADEGSSSLAPQPKKAKTSRDEEREEDDDVDDGDDMRIDGGDDDDEDELVKGKQGGGRGKSKSTTDFLIDFAPSIIETGVFIFIDDESRKMFKAPEHLNVKFAADYRAWVEEEESNHGKSS